MVRRPNRQLRMFRNVVVIGCVVAAVPVAKRYLHNFANSDAFKEMRKDAPHAVPAYLMRLEGVRMKHYDANQLITYAHCDTVDLAPDRHQFDLTGVHDALYRGKQGQFRYSADHAIYIDALSKLTANGNVHVTNKDLNLTAQSLACDGKTKKLKIPGHVEGILRGGHLDAARIDYDIDKGAYFAGPVRWKGMLAKLDPQFGEVERAVKEVQKRSKPADKAAPAEDDKPTVWDIQGETVESTGSDTPTLTYTKAVATDGEIILIAPTVVQDRKTDVIHATGRVQYFSAKADIVADECVIYRKEKRAVLTGHVVMYVKPKKDQDGKPKVETLPPFQPVTPDQVTAARPEKATDEEKKKADQLREGKTIRDFPTIVVSDKTEYWYAKGSRHAVITGSPQARQELPENRWRRAWTNVGFYDGEKETLKMISSQGVHDTRMKNSIGDDVTAEWMLVSTKEDDDTMSGHLFAGQFTSLDNEEVPSDKSKPAAANSKPAVTTQPATGQGTTTPPIKTGG